MPHNGVDETRVLYCSQPPLARDLIIAGIREIPGVSLDVVDSFESLIEWGCGYHGLVLADAPPAQAARLIENISTADSRVRRLHFISAGREGFLSAGIPSRFAVTGPDGASAPAVAEQAMALLLALLRRIPDAVRAFDERRWDRAAVVPRVRSLEGLTAAVVGVGSVGEQIARRLRAFGARTIGVVRTPRPAPAGVDEIVLMDALGEVLPRADVVLLSVALTEQTQGLIGADQFEMMKDTALLINVARGGVIDQSALIDALHNRKLGGAGLDVTDPEPLPESSALWSAPNLVITPHYGGASPHTFARTARSAVAMVETLVREREGDRVAC